MRKSHILWTHYLFKIRLWVLWFCDASEVAKHDEFRMNQVFNCLQKNSLWKSWNFLKIWIPMKCVSFSQFQNKNTHALVSIGITFRSGALSRTQNKIQIVQWYFSHLLFQFNGMGQRVRLPSVGSENFVCVRQKHRPQHCAISKRIGNPLAIFLQNSHTFEKF